MSLGSAFLHEQSILCTGRLCKPSEDSSVNGAVCTKSPPGVIPHPEVARAGVADSWHSVAHCDSGYPRLQTGQQMHTSCIVSSCTA